MILVRRRGRFFTVGSVQSLRPPEAASRAGAGKGSKAVKKKSSKRDQPSFKKGEKPSRGILLADVNFGELVIAELPGNGQDHNDIVLADV